MKHALLIDDNEVDNYVSKHIITRSKLVEKISVASSAKEALEFLNSLLANSNDFPNIIMLDIRMPEMDGFEFLDEFVKFPKSIIKGCNIIMLSSSNDQSDIEKSNTYKVVKGYLNKPLDIVLFVDLVNTNVQNS
ncbi:MAG: response regulator [Bacteroidetes bacterium]|nr:response regulator [Bacteroidota bacterium]